MITDQIINRMGMMFYIVRVYTSETDICDIIYMEKEIKPLKQESEDSRVDETKKTEYQKKIEELMDRQREKGLSKYGVTLEQNVTLTLEQRIEHLEEELIDGLMYCEHLKAGISEGSLTVDDYQRAALRTARVDEFSKEDLFLNGLMGLCGETGEVIDMVKKERFQGHEKINREDFIKELGDVAWYLALTAYAYGVPLSEVFEKNISKLKKRYPDGFDKERSIHRERENKAEE